MRFFLSICIDNIWKVQARLWNFEKSVFGCLSLSSQVSSRMGNANTSSIIGTLFEARILQCHHTPTIELTVPNHQACQACCRWQMCESHDPANPDMLILKRAIHTLTNLASATPTPTPTPTTSGQSDGNVQAGNSGNRRIITLLFF